MKGTIKELTQLASDAGEISERGEIVEIGSLAHPDGAPAKVLVRALAIERLLPILKAIPVDEAKPPEDERIPVEPGLGGAVLERRAADFGASLKRIEDWQGPGREIARLGIVKPRFSFDSTEDGSPRWDLLPFADQMAIVNAIMALSGFGREETAPLRRFPGGDDGGGSGSE